MSHELKPFKASERQNPAGQLTGWRSRQVPLIRYPFLQLILDSEQFEPLLEKCEKTCRVLEEMKQSGNPELHEQARLIMNAYGRALDLLGELTTLKDQISKK